MHAQEPQSGVAPHLTSFSDALYVFFCGLCMGSADIVPGVSGGTMALILGIYEKFIFAVKSLGTKASWFKKNVSWDFLLVLVLGIVSAMAAFSHLLDGLINDPLYRIYLYHFFIGMIAASLVYCCRQIQSFNSNHLWAIAAGALVAFFLTGTKREPIYDGLDYDANVSKEFIGKRNWEETITNYDKTTETLKGVSSSMLSAMLAQGVVSPDSLVYNKEESRSGMVTEFVSSEEPSILNTWLILCGAIAICAMMLPGISGSYLLVILGAYPIVIAAITDLVAGFSHATVDWQSFWVLMNVALGIGLGAILFSRVLSWLILHYHNLTMATLLGLMIGALRALWPYWTYTYYLNPLKLGKGAQLFTLRPYLPGLSAWSTWSAFSFLIFGFLLVLGLEFMASFRKDIPN